MSGGLAGGFVDSAEESKEDKPKPRLFQAKKSGRSVRHYEVPVARESLNHGDAFVLDAGTVCAIHLGSNPIDQCCGTNGRESSVPKEKYA